MAVINRRIVTVSTPALIGNGDGIQTTFDIPERHLVPGSVMVYTSRPWLWSEVETAWGEVDDSWAEMYTPLAEASYTINASQIVFGEPPADGTRVYATYSYVVLTYGYTARLLDKDRQLLAVVDHHLGWQYTRRPNEATNLTLTLPRVGVLPQADMVAIYRGTSMLVTGRIAKRDIADESITLQCHTEEILLSENITPAQYGAVFEGKDLADVARACLSGWHVMRVKGQDEWGDAVAASNIDLTTEPGVVMLARNSGQYVPSGYIILRFLSESVPGFESWDRIRWAADNVAPVRTTMQYRYGPSSDAMSDWSTAVEGALPDQLGVVPSTPNAAILDVRINLYTDDTTSPDPDGNPVGQTPVLYAVEVIARTWSRVSAGAIPTSAGVVVHGLEADNSTALDVLKAACEQTEWEFNVTSGQLNLAERLGQDRTAQVLLRTGTNMQIETLGDNYDEMVNDLMAYGPGSGISRLYRRLTNADSIQAYGLHPGTKEFPDATTVNELNTQALAWLDDNCLPFTEFRVQAIFAPEEEPEYGCGDTVRVVDTRSGVVTTARIESETRQYGIAGVRVTLELNRLSARLVDQIFGRDVDRNPLPPPTGVHWQDVNGVIYLSWQGHGADSWEVWHSETEDGEYRRLAQVSQPRYEHAGLQAESENWYVIYACKGTKRSAAAGPYHVVAKGQLDLDATYAMGSDEDGMVTIRHATLECSNSAGDATRISPTGLVFVRNGATQLYFRGAQVGMAADGDELVFPFSTSPKIVLMPMALPTFDPTRSGVVQRIRADVVNIRYEDGAWRGNVICRLVEGGVWTYTTVDQAVAVGSSWTSGGSDPGTASTTQLAVNMRLQAIVSAGFGFPGATWVTWNYVVRYRLVGSGTWTSHTYSRTAGPTNNPWVTPYSEQESATINHTYEVSPGNYEMQVAFSSVTRSNSAWTITSSEVRVISWGDAADDTIATGTVSYVAMEGGE